MKKTMKEECTRIFIKAISVAFLFFVAVQGKEEGSSDELKAAASCSVGEVKPERFSGT